MNLDAVQPKSLKLKTLYKNHKDSSKIIVASDQSFKFFSCRFENSLKASMQSSIQKLAYEQLYDKNPFIQLEKDEW